jgi:rhamnosyltransferase
VLTLDHDSVADPAMVDKMIISWRTRPDRESVMIVAPRFIDINAGFEPRYPVYRGFWPKFPRFTESVSMLEPMEVITSGSLVRTDVFERAGFFCEEMFVDYVDIEFCLRVSSAGFKILVPRDAVLRHELGKAKERKILRKKVITLNHSPERRYYIARNRIHVMRRYAWKYPSFFLFSLREAMIDLIRICLVEDRTGQKLVMMTRGVIDGVLGRMGILNWK